MVTNNSIDNTIVNGTTIIFDSAGVVEINSSGGAISIGNDANDFAVNVGTAGVRTVTVGNITGASVLALKCGTGDFTLASATGTVISALDTGEVTMPLQSAFLAQVGNNVVNQTGAGAVVTVVYDSEIFDQNADYNPATGIFTAPRTGRYKLDASVTLSGNVAATIVLPKIVSSNRSLQFYYGYNNSWSADNILTYRNTLLIDMDAADTVYYTVEASNGAGNTISILGSASDTSFFSVYLAC